ncbi:DNA-binding response regulator [Vallitalea longa]|uniref:Stage 0 sporulation protein A homolog n=1 Tax=Vallitalea longa TaxID=2936439 RepID=A0A9W6DEK1_9FIRM|nr:LytTR family DNA-binding domain-containing protein [Vallitalea longa]GKX28533.1 DNA-binding response regulator [Vallitalea longa]
MNNILIVEDSDTTRENLEYVLKTNFKDLRIYKASTGKIAIKLLKQIKMDLFFLDIQLPDINGLKIAEIIRSMEQYELSYIIFITTHLMYLPKAVQEYHCYDFIEKPFTKSKIIDVTNRLLKGINKTNEKESDKKYITIKLKYVIHKVLVNDIFYVESYRRKLYLHTKLGKIVIPNMTFKQMLEMIDKTGVDYFVRTHRSYVVNINHIRSIKKHNKKAWDIYFCDYDEVALIGEKYSESVIKRIEGVK